jgi:hypothetical protein
MMAGGQIPPDPDAVAFLTATGITDPTITLAIDTLVKDLKFYGIWTKMKALYPFVGGTAVTHKFNLKDPQDTNAAFRLVFAGGWTHSANGAQPNGTNGYANTNFNPLSILSLNNTHISIYSRTSLIVNNQRDLSVFIAGLFPSLSLGTNTNVFLSDQYSSFTNRISASITNALGFYTGNRTSSTVHKLFKNGSQIGSTDTFTNSQNLPNANLFLGAANYTTGGVGSYSNKQYAFASIGDGLNDTEAANYYTAVQSFQTTLGRQV